MSSPMDHWPPYYPEEPSSDLWASPVRKKEPRGLSLSLTLIIVILVAALSSGLTIALTEPVLVQAPNSGAPVVKISEEKLQGTPGLENVLDSVFTIAVTSPVASGSGSGVAVSPTHVATNAHVVTVGGQVSEEDVLVEVQDSMGNEYEATVVGIDELADVAVLSVPGLQAKPVQWDPDATVEVGETVIAVGAPLGLSNTVTSGIVSSLYRPVNLAGEGDSDATVINAIQTDAAINSGNSGGPLVNSDGQLVGLNVAISTGPTSNGNIGIGYAIPGPYAKRVIEEIIETGSASHGKLSVEVSTRGSAGGAFEDGAKIEQVLDGGAADEAGIKQGDIVIGWEGLAVPSAGSLIGFVKAEKPGSEVLVTVERAGKERVLRVKLEAL